MLQIRPVTDQMLTIELLNPKTEIKMEIQCTNEKKNENFTNENGFSWNDWCTNVVKYRYGTYVYHT